MPLEKYFKEIPILLEIKIHGLRKMEKQINTDVGGHICGETLDYLNRCID